MNLGCFDVDDTMIVLFVAVFYLVVVVVVVVPLCLVSRTIADAKPRRSRKACQDH